MKILTIRFKDYVSIDYFTKSAISALIIYTIIIFFSVDNISSRLSIPFNNMVKMIEINKQKIIMQSLFAESELHRPEIIDKYQYSEAGNDKVYVYSKNGESSLNQNEKNILPVLSITKKYTPIAFGDELVSLLYRSYESQTYITTGEIKHFPKKVFDAMNTEERCAKIRVCTKFESDIQLSDRILVSPFYKDLLTGKTTVTLSSPVYGEEGKQIIGDLNADFHVSDYFSNGFAFTSEFQGEFKNNIIADKSIWSPSLTYSSSFMADGNTTFVFKLSYSTIYFHHFWLFFVLFFLVYIIIYKWNEVRSKRSELHYAHQDSIKDALTGLYNRKIFDSDFFLERVRENCGSIIAIDGNNIKTINDNYGHSVGDLAIQCIADKMKDNFRASDFLIRTGGDEFIVILPGCSFDIAHLLSGELQQSIEDGYFYNGTCPLSISCGVVFSESDESFEDAMLRADKVLYEQKSKRQNDA